MDRRYWKWTEATGNGQRLRMGGASWQFAVTVGTIRGQQEGSQYSRVSDTGGWR